MVEDRIARLAGHLRSLANFRARALAEGDQRQAARAEQAIINMEAQVAGVIGDLERQERSTEGAEGTTGEEQRAGRNRQHILVINGDPDFLNMLRSLLQDERYNVTTTNFVPESFAMIDALHPALLMIDLVVGERAGWDLLARLHKEAGTRGIPTIAVSESEEELEQVRWGEGRGGERRAMHKPLDLHVLLDTVGEMIGKA
jgi:CheY-like chemotaxis protein